MTSTSTTLTDHFSQAADKFLNDWEMKHSAVPDVLWHYTGIGGFKGLVEKGEMWFSDASFLNDPSEMSYAVDLLETVTESYVDGRTFSAEASEFLSRIISAVKSDRDNRLDLGITGQAFVACFCEKGDSLHLWRAYTGNRGYSFGFFPNEVIANLDSLNLKSDPSVKPYRPVLRKVIYDVEEQTEIFTVLLDIFVAAVDDYVSTHGSMGNHVFSRGFYRAFFECLSSFKHPEYHEEHEWRIIYLPEYAVATTTTPPYPECPIEFREGPNGYVIPFIRQKVGSDLGGGKSRLPFQELITGPALDANIARHAVNALLYHTGYLGTVLTVRPSKVPVR